jgi:ribonuclease HII
MPPTLTHEYELLHAGYHCIAGIDEAGRGCWAGPVVAAAVVLRAEVLAQPALLAGVDDSKLLTATQRERCYDVILAHAAGVGVGIVPAYLIDGYGILAATRLAMTTALLSLPCSPDALLIDAVQLRELTLHQRALIRGDSISLSIAAASIVAKVSRDRHMVAADQAHPGYSFARHKGYGTAIHQAALRQLGLCALHRRTFQPVAEVAEHSGGEDLRRSKIFP